VAAIPCTGANLDIPAHCSANVHATVIACICGGQPLRVFLSFNSKDLKLAEAMRDGLLRLEPGDIFFHPLSITAGFWLPKLAEKIADTDAFILLASGVIVGSLPGRGRSSSAASGP
jgi:hypothetical protein